MQDRPTVRELLDAVRAFLADDVVPALEGRRRFHALVAANVVDIVNRELAAEGGHLDTEWRRLAVLLGEAGTPPAELEAKRSDVRRLSERLCERIRNGDADAGGFHAAVRAHLRATVRDKLAVANPRLLGPA
jgi:hypothetical protein